ncbi:MAG: hypothetical protein V1904_08995 [Bacteroidota bacterium]
MKNLLIIILLCSIGACKSSVLLNNTNKLMEGTYFGNKGLIHVFVKIKKDSVFIDWFQVEKRTYYIFADTIIISNDGINKLQGKNAVIYEKKNKLYIEANPFNHKEVTCIKIKRNEEKYKECESFKNIAYIHKKNSIYTPSNNEYQAEKKLVLINKFKKEYEIDEKIYILKHKDFVIEYEIFLQALQKELLLMDE